jgi:hypothetical protein
VSGLISAALAAGIGGAITLLIVGLTNSMRTHSSLPRRVTRLEAAGALSLEVLDALTDGTIASLEAVSGKRCNGNVDEALDILRDSKKSTRKFLASHSMGQEPKEEIKA